MKMSFKSALKKTGLSLCAAAAVLLWSTCDVGLGEAVDTMAPTVSVTAPAASAVCAGSVVISGDCADDKGIASVNIVVKNIYTGDKYEYSAEISKDMKSWTKTINELAANAGYPLVDGSYTADVTAIDIYGRSSGTSSTAFDIDNTEPIFCVTSPATFDISDPRKYGRSVTISGEIADDHDIAKMDIRVFRTDAAGSNPMEITSQLAKTTFTDFETAGGTTVYIAKYFEGANVPTDAQSDDYKLYKNYMAIYGDAELGTDVYIYIVPTLTDAAGNTSLQSYISSDVKKVIAGACGVETTIDSLQTAQLMKIYNGTYTLGELNDEQKKKVVSILKGTYKLQPGDKAYYCQYDDKDENKRSPYAADVNSNNSPTYDFNGYETPTANSEGWVGVNTGGTITITLKAGRDDWGILPNSLEVNLYEYDALEPDHKKRENPGDDPKIVFSSNPFKDPTQVATVTIKDATNTETKNISTSVTTQSYYVTLPSLRAGNYYVLEAEGKDENDSGLEPSSEWYGFMVSSSVTPPTFTAEDLFYAAGSALSVGEGLKVKLNITDVSDNIKANGVKVTAYRYEDHIPGKAYIANYTAPAGVEKIYKGQGEGGATGSAPIEGGDVANHYYLDLPIKDFAFAAAAGKNYSIVIKACGGYRDDQGYETWSSEATFMVWIDAAAPELTITSPKDTENVITEKFASYEHDDDSGKTWITPRGNWSDLGGSATHRMWYSEDDAGTPSLVWTEASGTFVSGTSYYEKQVAGATDAESCYALLDTDKYVAGQTPVEGYYKLALKASSDGTGGTWNEIKDVSQVASSTTWEQKIQVAENEGKMFRVVGVDAVGNLSFGAHDAETGTQIPSKRDGLTFDFSVPTAELASEPTVYQNNGVKYYNKNSVVSNVLTIKFEASDLRKIDAAGVTVSATKNGAAVAKGSGGFNYTTEQAKDEHGNDDPTKVLVTVTLAAPTSGTGAGANDGKWVWTVNAADAAGRSAAPYDLERTVDTVAPVFDTFSGTGSVDGKKIAVGSGEASTWTDPSAVSSWYSSAGLVFNAKIIEATSGLAEIDYTGRSAGAQSDDLEGKKTLEAGKPVNVAVTGFAQSKRAGGVLTNNALEIWITDNAGNASLKESVEVKVDQTAPAFAAAYYTFAASPAADDLAVAEGTLYSDGTKAVTVYGTVSNDLSGVAELLWQSAGSDADDKSIKPAMKFTTDASIAPTATVPVAPASAYVAINDYDADTDPDGWRKYDEIPDADKYKITGWKAALIPNDDTSVTPKIPKSLISGAVTVAAKSVVQKETKSPIFTIDRDETAPTIAIKTPAVGKSVNGQVNISGSADDMNLDTLQIFYKIGDAGEYTALANAGSKYNWNVDCVVSRVEDGKYKFGASGDAEYTGTVKTLYLKVTATDKAKNTATEVFEYSVNPDSDRPKITFTVPEKLSQIVADVDEWMSPLNYILKKGSSILRAKVEDDDGLTGLKVWYNDNGLKKDGNLVWLPEGDEGLKLTSGVFDIFSDNNGQHEGKHDILIKVEDAKGTTFITSVGGTEDDDKSWLRPKIHKDGKDAAETFFGGDDSGDSSLYIAIDTLNPDITNRSYFIDYMNPGVENKVENSVSSLGLLGGKRDKFTLYFYAYDASGLKQSEMEFEFNGHTYKEGSASYPLVIADTPTDFDGKDYYLVTVKDIAIPEDLPSGSNYSGTIKVVDNADLDSSLGVPVEVDNDAPELTIINPSQSSTQTVSGKVNAYGTVTGADNETKLYYALTYEDDDIQPSAATSLPDASAFAEIKQKSNLMWYVYFDGGAAQDETHAAKLNDFLIGKSATIGGVVADDETVAGGSFKLPDDGRFKDGIPIYLWIKAVDAVGNEVVSQPLYDDQGEFVKYVPYKILFDPQGSKPEVSFSYPDKNGETIGGEFKVYGGAKAKDKDNPTIKAVFAQIISKAHEYKDASYTPPESGWGTLTTETDSKGNITGVTAFEPSAADLDYLKAAGYTVVKMKGYPATVKVWSGSLAIGETAADYAALATVNGSSWSLKLNAKSEFDPKAATEESQAATTNIAAVRVFSCDGVNLSNSVDRAFIVDSDTPQLKDLQLEQFGADGTSASATASREYEDDIYVTGKWFLTFYLKDGQALGKIKIGKAATKDDASKAANVKTYLDGTTIDGDVAKCHVAGEYDRIDIKLPLETNTGCGSQYVYVYYEDTSGKGGANAAKTYKISFDNTAPTLAKVADQKYTFDKDNKEIVQQNDGWYSFGSKVSEPDVGGTAQSGFERLAFYFTRGDYIFDPMIKKGAVEKDNSDNPIAGNKFSITKAGLTQKYGLWWKSVAVSDYSKNVITLSASHANIHKGGLVEFDGVIYRINDLTEDGTKIGITGGPESSAKTTALFAIANVVDNETQESSDESVPREKTKDYGFGYGTPSNDDGDLMVETLVNDNTDWTWNANIYSKNISDGPIQIHYVAFDKAGNWAQAGGPEEKTADYDPPIVTGTVSNNAPRIANLYVGTDLNGNNEIDGEFNGDTAAKRNEWAKPYQATSLTWNQDYNDGTALTSVTLDAKEKDEDPPKAYLTAKGMTVVKPEILGGNGNIYYGYKISNSAGTKLAEGNNTSAAFITSAQTIVDPLANEEGRRGDITIQVGDFTSNGLRTGGIPDCSETSPHKFEFTFYDQTETASGAAPTGSAIFAGTNTAKATVYMAVSMTDAVEPQATRQDLFWNGAGAADDEGEPKNSIVWDVDTPLGHIDLSADLPTDIPNFFTEPKPTDDQYIRYNSGTNDRYKFGKSTLDRDSKVSGQIVLRGTVSDNKMLDNIYLKFTMPKQNNTTDPMTILGTGDGKAGLPTNSSYGYCVATYKASSGEWVMPVGTDVTLESYGIKFTVTNNKISSTGHSADWEFVWDTSYVVGVTNWDVTVDVYSSDQIIKSALSANSGKTVTAYKSLNGSVYYTEPTATENNFSATTHPDQLKVDVVPYITGLETILSKKGVDAARSAKGRWPVKSSEKFTVKGFNFSKGNGNIINQTRNISGYYAVTKSNNCTSFNNCNNNNAALSGTDYTNAYNRQPNGRNNDLLTDDVYIDSWTVQQAATLGSQTIENPVMKINPKNGMIGFAFRYGAGQQSFAMPNGNGNNYQAWHTGQDTKYSVTFAYDSNGNTYSTTADGDSASYYSDFFSLHSSLWEPSSNGVLDGTNCSRIEMTGQTGSKSGGDVKYYSLATKYQSPVIATARSNVYLAYYDSFNKEIRFRSSLGESFKDGENYAKPGNFVDLGHGNQTISRYVDTVENCQIVAEETSTAKPGEYVSMAAIPSGGSGDDALVMVWYDGSRMWYSYNDTPNTNRAPVKRYVKTNGETFTAPTGETVDRIEKHSVGSDHWATAVKDKHYSVSGKVYTAKVDNVRITTVKKTQTTINDRETFVVPDGEALAENGIEFFNSDSNKWEKAVEGAYGSWGQWGQYAVSDGTYTALVDNLRFTTVKTTQTTINTDETFTKPEDENVDKVEWWLTNAYYWEDAAENTDYTLSNGVYTAIADEIRFTTIKGSQTTLNNGQTFTKPAGDLMYKIKVWWWDATEGTDYSVSGNTYTALTDNVTFTTITPSVNGQSGADGWSRPTNIFGSTAIGKYCKVAVDGNGGVHIAAQDATTGSVWYAYLSSHTSSVEKLVKVDTGNVGKCLTIDVALDPADNVTPMPYISYYSSGKSLPKFARLATPGVYGDGIEGGKYTGTWEISLVPSDSKIREDNINVGVWKTSAGVLKSSPGSSNFKIYGNGSANAVLGYKYTDASKNSKGYVESAQLIDEYNSN